VRLVTVDPACDPAWVGLLGRHPASLFHSPPWLAALREAYGFVTRAHVVQDAAGASIAGLAFCEIDDLLGRRILSLPFSDACDPLVGAAEPWERLYAALTAAGLPMRLRCLDNPVLREDRRFAVTRRAHWHTMPVTGGVDALWSSLAGPARRAIRKAERSGVEIRPLAGGEGVGEFRRLHVALRRRKYRMLAQPLAFFEALRHHFTPVNGWFPVGAFVGPRLVAATVYLRWGDTLYYKFNASSLDDLNLRPNSLLVWAGIRLARSLGCNRLDLGPSDDDQPGLIRFKRNFGAVERELRVLDYRPPGWRDDRADAVRRLLGDLTSLLTAAELSDEVAARAGTLLYRFFA
jgi:CelD/BcsL family acetyltransferase involved in cellulose biosynthesis